MCAHARSLPAHRWSQAVSHAASNNVVSMPVPDFLADLFQITLLMEFLHVMFHAYSRIDDKY